MGVETIATPHDEIRNLIRQAKALDERAQTAIKKVKSPLNPILGDYAVKSLVPHGFKGAVRSAGKNIYRDHKDEIDVHWREEGVRLTDHCVSKIGGMSSVTKNMTMSGNSRKLVTKFNRLTNKKTALAYIRNLISILEGIEKLDLIWNTDIESELKRRVEEKEWLRREEEALKLEARAIVEEATRSQFSRKDSIMKRLEVFPRSRRSLVSAFTQLQSPDPEGPRHCIFSSRISIEQLCMDAGASGDWKKGLANLVSSGTDRRQVKAIWNHLSGKGAHGGHDPTTKEAERCLTITLTSLEMILDNIDS